MLSVLCATIGGAMYRLMITFVLLACLVAPTARADDAEWLQKLDDIATLSNTSNDEALAQLGVMKAVLPINTSYTVRKEMLLLQIRILFDAGRLEQAYALNEDLLTLATNQHDPVGIALAQLGEVDRLLDQNKAAAALERARQLETQFTPGLGPVVTAQLNLRMGRAYNALANYERALNYFLAALKAADSMPRGAADVRLTALANASRLYVNIKNPEAALEAVHKAQALANHGEGKVQANLYNTEGTALVALGRHKEGIAAFQHSLDLAYEVKLDTLAAKVLGKMSDAYLRQHDYRAAEHTARDALLTAERVKERNSVLMAKANIGFALGGQGKLDEARPYIDEVIAAFRQAASPRNLEQMLDEASRMYERNGLYKEALTFTREQQTLRASLYDAERAKAVAGLQESYDAANRTRQIALLARENALKDAELGQRRTQQTLALLGTTLTVLAGALIYWLYRRVRKANSKLQQLNTKLEFHAMRDPLTGLYNRRSFVERMQQRGAADQQERRHESGRTVDCFTLLDIDNFKDINDSMGHAGGDQVLIEIATRLNRSVRESDMVLRWGGEEFLVYSSKAPAEQLEGMVKRILDAAVGLALVGSRADEVKL